VVNFSIILESLKFYKLKNDRLIQIWFILLYVLNLLVYVLPIGDNDFSRYFDMLAKILEEGSLPAGFALPFTTGNLVFLGMTLLITLFNAFCTLAYAALYISEFDGLRPAQVVQQSLAALPRLILFGLLILVPAIMTACLAFIPLIVFGVMMYFLPLYLILDKHKLAESMHQSFLSTRNRKIFIFAQAALISFVISVPRNLILNFFPDAVIPMAIIASFFAVLQTFIQGRLMGILYLVIVKKAPLVLPSKPKDRG
jgi:hypothetical protein